MKRAVFAALALTLGAGAPAAGDQPRAVAAATACSLSGRVCATREGQGVTVWRHLPGGGRRALWRAGGVLPGEFQVADDDRSLVAVQPWANLVQQDAVPGTVVFAFHRPGAAPVRVTLAEVVRDPAALPRTASHRRWARSFGYDGRGRFRVDATNSRSLLYDPLTGRRAR